AECDDVARRVLIDEQLVRHVPLKRPHVRPDLPRQAEALRLRARLEPSVPNNRDRHAILLEISLPSGLRHLTADRSAASCGERKRATRVRCIDLFGRAVSKKRSENGHLVASSYCSWRSDHRIHASAWELTQIADLQPIVAN